MERKNENKREEKVAQEPFKHRLVEQLWNEALLPPFTATDAQKPFGPPRVSPIGGGLPIKSIDAHK